MLKFLTGKTGSDAANILTIFIFSMLACLPIMIYGIPNSADMAQHYQFAVTFYDSIKDGIWYPSLAHLTNTGFGDIGVRFYPPLSYYVLIVFRFLTGDWFIASCATFCFWFFASGIGVYLWAKEWFSRRASVFAAIIYLFIPYHANELYNSFLYAEFAASAVLPFCFLFVTRICRRGKMADVLGLSISYALLVLTNLPLALIGSVSLLFYALLSLDRKDFFNRALKLGAAVLLGLGASSFYWLRMLLEIGFVRHSTAQFSTADRYDFHNYFAFSYFFMPTDAPDVLKSLWYLDTMMIVTFGVFLPSIIIYYRYRNADESPKLFNVLGVLILAGFLTSILSAPVWENISLLQKVQFPWRWLAIFSLGGVIFNAAAFEHVVKFCRTEKRWLSVMVFGLLFAAFCFTGIKIMRPVYQYSRADFNPIVERLRTSGSYDCWLPVWVQKIEIKELNSSVAERPREMIANKQREKIIRFPAGNASETLIQSIYYPHWQATINGAKTEVGKAANGMISLPIPPEETIVKLEFVEPAYVETSKLISFFCWFVILGFGIILILPAVRRKISGHFSADR